MVFSLNRLELIKNCLTRSCFLIKDKKSKQPDRTKYYTFLLQDLFATSFLNKRKLH